MLRDKSNKRIRICLNLLAMLSKSGTTMAVPSVPVATALHILLSHDNSHHCQLTREAAMNKKKNGLEIVPLIQKYLGELFNDYLYP